MKRTALARKVPLAKKRKAPRRVAATCVVRGCRRRPVQGIELCASHAKREADRIFSLIVRASNNGCCYRCGRPATDTSHVLSRKYVAVRWNLANALPACRACHHRQHQWPVQNRRELEELLGYVLQRLEDLALAGGRPDYAAVLADLRGKAEFLGVAS